MGVEAIGLSWRPISKIVAWGKRGCSSILNLGEQGERPGPSLIAVRFAGQLIGPQGRDHAGGQRLYRHAPVQLPARAHRVAQGVFGGGLEGDGDSCLKLSGVGPNHHSPMRTYVEHISTPLVHTGQGASLLTKPMPEIDSASNAGHSRVARGQSMGTKIEVRAGDIEFAFESDQAISVSEAKSFIDQVHEMAKSVGGAKAKPNGSSAPPSLPKNGDGGGTTDIDLHVNSVAERLNVKSASDVAMAAAAYLQLVKGNASYSRSDLLAAMREATNYYNENMRANLTKTLKRLTGTKLNQLANKTFSIKAPELAKFRDQLAQ